MLHWGADLGALDAGTVRALTRALPLAATNDAVRLTLVPTQAEGWIGRPGLAGHREGSWPYPRLALTRPVALEDGSVRVRAADVDAGIALTTELVLSPEGVLRIRHALTNTGTGPYTVERVDTLLPVPADALELLDFTGRWARERAPQRGPFTRFRDDAMVASGICGCSSRGEPSSRKKCSTRTGMSSGLDRRGGSVTLTTASR